MPILQIVQDPEKVESVHSNASVLTDLSVESYHGGYLMQPLYPLIAI
jgi:3-methyladenine DNA glycosylase Tag